MNSKRWLRSLAALALVTTGPGAASAQSPVKAQLFTRTAHGLVRAAMVVDVDRGWHIYHKELGHPQAIGQATTVAFLGEGITWSDVKFPEPMRLDQSDVGGPGVFILAHEGHLVLYAAGRI